MNSCSGKGMQHMLPLPVTHMTTYMDSLKRTREELIDTYPDTDFYWVTPGPVDFRMLNNKEIENKHDHFTTTDTMWKAMISNYNKRLKVINDEIPGNMTINWFTRSCWQNRDNRGKKSDDSIKKVLQGDLAPIKSTGLIDGGGSLTVKGAQAMWMIIRKKINWYRKAQAKEKARTETEKEEDPSGNTEDKNEEGVNGKADEDAQTENDLNDGQKKNMDESTEKTTIIGDSWIQILSEIERWHPDLKKRRIIKAYPDLTLESVIEKVDEVLSEETDTKNVVLSVFQNIISSGLSAENVENEIIPCAFSTVEDLLEKASNIDKYIKKSYPHVKVFWVSPGPVGCYSGVDKEEEEKKEEEKKEEEKKEEEKKQDSKKQENEKEETEKEDKEEDEKEGSDEELEETKDEKTEKEAEHVEEEQKEEDPEVRKLRRACRSCNTIAMILSKRLYFHFKKQVVDWFDIFTSNRSGRTDLCCDPEIEGQILEGKVVKYGYLDEDFVNLSELGGNKLMKLIINTLSGSSRRSCPRSRLSNDNRSPGFNNRRGGGVEGRVDGGRGRGRGSGSGRGQGQGVRGRKDFDMTRRPIDKRLSWDGRGNSQHDPWGQQGGGNWKGQNRRFQGQGQGHGHGQSQSQDMRDIINRERTTNYQRGGGDWGRSSQYVDPWARYEYSGYYNPRY
ncbi:unnamed protein product [Meganyctiphanes norvegica]|uniref:Uncharacterized protein n=1 Tax=Meganyctiphanes norvegica TaxID=48144 RepID=A0AAV2PKQ2_MEGNR